MALISSQKLLNENNTTNPQSYNKYHQNNKYRLIDISKDKNIALVIFLKFFTKFLSPFIFLLS